MTKSNQPRLPNAKEKQQLIAWRRDIGGEFLLINDPGDAEKSVDNAFITVIDNVTNSFGDEGKVMIVLWSGYPAVEATCDVFNWNSDGDLCPSLIKPSTVAGY